MNLRIRNGIVIGLTFIVLHGCGTGDHVQKSHDLQECAGVANNDGLQEGLKTPDLKEIHDIGVQAYVYGYPLVLMELTRKVMTSVIVPQHDARSPINQFGHATGMPTPEMTDVVRPNIDTLYSSAWLDVEKEPIVLSLPVTRNRFYVMALYDMYTNNFSIIQAPRRLFDQRLFIITGPAWHGKIPAKVKQIKSPSNRIWLIGRTQIMGPHDVPNARVVQAQYRLMPLSVFTSGSPIMPASAKGHVKGHHSSVKKPMDQAATLSAADFFTMMMQLMAHNPPPSADSELCNSMARIGLIPSEHFDFNALNPAIKSVLEKVPHDALKVITEHGKALGKNSNGWNIMTANIGTYGTHYLDRAAVALVGLGALPATISLYPTTVLDSEGQRLTGAHRYIIHFDRHQLPPARTFWSLTMYDAQGFLVHNPLHRYAIGDRDKLRRNKDGSIDIFIQHRSPGRRNESNWLPAPKGEFSLTLRLYMPEKSALNGSWKPPFVKKVD